MRAIDAQPVPSGLPPQRAIKWLGTGPVIAIGVGALLGLAVAFLPLYLWAPSLALVLSAWLAVVNTRRAVQLAVFLVPWQIYLGNVAGSTYTFRLIDMVVGCSLLVSLLRFPRTRKLAASVWLLPPILFVGLGVLSGLRHGDLFPVAKFIVDWWPGLAFYWLALIWGPSMWQELIGIFLFTFSLQAGLALVQTMIGNLQAIHAALSRPIFSLFFEPDFLQERLANDSFNFIWQGRVFGFGTYLNSAGLGVNLAAAGTVAWALTMRARRMLGSPYLYLSLLLSVACVLVLKRSGWVAMGVGFFIVMALNFGPRWANLRRAVLVLVLAAILVVPIVLKEGGALLARATDQATFDYGRQNVWPVYLHLVLQQPVLGYGPRYPMGSLETGLAIQQGLYTNYPFGLDNSYLYLALVAGLPGLLLMLLTVAYALSRFRRSDLNDRRTLAQAGFSGLAAYMAGGLFLVILGDLQVAGTFFLLLALARVVAGAPATDASHG